MKRFCSHPFNRAHLSPSGSVFVCCAAWLNMPIGNIFKEPFPDIWNSPTAKKIRESIHDESFRFCKWDKCPRIISKIVEREVNNETFLDIIKEKRVTLDTGPRLLSLNYDNSCNLYCESCRDKVKVLDKKRQEELIRFQDALIETDFFKKVKRLTVSGVGEVFASRVLMDLLTNKITESHFPELKIILRTNGILLTRKNWERIKNVHYAIDTISISIDAATEKTYRLLRRGGDFNRLLENLGFLKELKRKNNIKVILHFVVQKQNYREMPGFVRLAKTYDCDRVNFGKIFNLGTYNSNDFHDAAIHDPGHPEFPGFKKILADPLLKDPMVKMKNLANLME